METDHRTKYESILLCFSGTDADHYHIHTIYVWGTIINITRISEFTVYTHVSNNKYYSIISIYEHS